MKKVILAFSAFLLLNSALNAQTTWDEYNYCIAGYKDVLTKGADVKSGYSMTPAKELVYYFGDQKNTVWVRRLVKNSTNKIVAYMIVYQLGDKAKEQSFYCVPHPESNSDITKKFQEDIGWINSVEANSIYKLRSILFAIATAVKW